MLRLPSGGGGGRVGKSLFVAGKCASSGWSVYYKPRGKWDRVGKMLW